MKTAEKYSSHDGSKSEKHLHLTIVYTIYPGSWAFFEYTTAGLNLTWAIRFRDESNVLFSSQSGDPNNLSARALWGASKF